MTTPNPREIEALAERLTKAQRTALLNAEADRPAFAGDCLFLKTYRDRGVLVGSIVELGLATIVMRGVMLNDLGEQARAHLERTSSNV